MLHLQNREKLLTRFMWSLSWTKIDRTENIEGTETCCVLQVEEVRRHSHCLAFSSAGPQSQTYYVSYDSYTEHLRWQRTASKVRRRISACASLPMFLHFYWPKLNNVMMTTELIMSPVPHPLRQIASQRVNSVDLSCCSLEELPAQLFYSQDLTHLNLKNNFMSPHKGVPALTRWVSTINTHTHSGCAGAAGRWKQYFLLCFPLVCMWNVPLCFCPSWGATIWSKEEAA